MRGTSSRTILGTRTRPRSSCSVCIRVDTVPGVASTVTAACPCAPPAPMLHVLGSATSPFGWTRASDPPNKQYTPDACSQCTCAAGAPAVGLSSSKFESMVFHARVRGDLGATASLQPRLVPLDHGVCLGCVALQDRTDIIQTETPSFVRLLTLD